MLSKIVVSALASLGTHTIHNPDSHPKDPTTEEEFLQIQYEPSDLKITWEAYNVEYQKRIEKVGKRILRSHRDYLLAKSDWIMQPDVIETIANKNEWITYRQALRDLTNTVTEYIWKENYSDLDFKRMNMPQAPAVIRKYM